MLHDQVRSVLYALAERNNGRLMPQAVVEAARDPESPLHAAFTWDDTKAAEQHRLNQARSLIRSVRVDVTTEHFSITAPAFVRDPGAVPLQGYTSIGRLRNDTEMAREAVIAEFNRASAALTRAKAVAVALGLAEQIDEINAQVLVLTERASEAAAETTAN